MTICIQEGTYFHGIWVIDTPDVNYMACLSKPDGGKWKFQYRFRYITDDKVWDSDDKKSWYSMTMDGTEEEVLPHLLKTMRMLANKMGAELEFIELKMDGGNKEILNRMSAHRMMQHKTVTAQ